jgi:hypothetical protein
MYGLRKMPTRERNTMGSPSRLCDGVPELFVAAGIHVSTYSTSNSSTPDTREDLSIQAGEDFL